MDNAHDDGAGTHSPFEKAVSPSASALLSAGALLPTAFNGATSAACSRSWALSKCPRPIGQNNYSGGGWFAPCGACRSSRRRYGAPAPLLRRRGAPAPPPPPRSQRSRPRHGGRGQGRAVSRLSPRLFCRLPRRGLSWRLGLSPLKACEGRRPIGCRPSPPFLRPLLRRVRAAIFAPSACARFVSFGRESFKLSVIAWRHANNLTTFSSTKANENRITLAAVAGTGCHVPPSPAPPLGRCFSWYRDAHASDTKKIKTSPRASPSVLEKTK